MRTYTDRVLCPHTGSLAGRDDDTPSHDVELLERLRAGDEDLDLAALTRWRGSDQNDLGSGVDGDLELLAQLRERDWTSV